MTSWYPNRGDESPMTTSAILGVDKQDMIMPKQRRNWGLIIAIIISGVLLGGIGAAGVSIYQHVTNTTTALGGVATTTPATATSAGNNVPYAARSGRSGNPTVTVTATATPRNPRQKPGPPPNSAVPPFPATAAASSLSTPSSTPAKISPRKPEACSPPTPALNCSNPVPALHCGHPSTVMTYTALLLTTVLTPIGCAVPPPASAETPAP